MYQKYLLVENQEFGQEVWSVNLLEYNHYQFSDLIGQNSASKSLRSSQVY